MTKSITKSCILCNIGGIDTYTFLLKVNEVLDIYYIAKRGVDDEESAVQRPLDPKRIEPIKKFILNGNMFLNTFILNWSNTENSPIIIDNTIKIELINRSAQVIDGQHRLVGLEDAIKIDASIGEKEILVSMCIGLKTEDAARIFLNINYEQKPVPKSLMYDLFGLFEDKEHDIVRAGDIAKYLNDLDDSPYFGLIKMPGHKGDGVIDFSSVVNSIKESVGSNGVFYKHKIRSLEKQQKVFLNYFSAIKYFYNQKGLWLDKKKNPFLMTAGYIGAVNFLLSHLLIKCVEKKSFEMNTFIEFLKLDTENLFMKESLKNVDGKFKRIKVQQYLEENFLQNTPEENEYKF